jgi:hypothetical protein
LVCMGVLMLMLGWGVLSTGSPARSGFRRFASWVGLHGRPRMMASWGVLSTGSFRATGHAACKATCAQHTPAIQFW